MRPALSSRTPPAAKPGHATTRFPEQNSVDRFYEFALLGMLASGTLAIAGSGAIDAPSLALAGAALGARLLMLLGWVRWEIRPAWVTAATLLYLGFYALDCFVLSREFLTATIHLVFFVAIVKVLTGVTRRDYVFLQVIAFLQLLAASVLSISPTYFMFLISFLIFSVAAFASSEIRRAARGRAAVSRPVGGFSRRLAAITAFTALGILAITAGLFFVLPRTARAALEKFMPATGRVSGFSEEVTLGQTGDIRRSGRVVIHARFAEGVNAAGLKWRGAALGEFDGLKWYNSTRGNTLRRLHSGLLKIASDDQLRWPGARINYEAAMTRGADETLFIAGLPEHLRASVPFVVETPTGDFRLPFPEPDGARYVVHSYLDAEGAVTDAGTKLTENERNFYLRLPPTDSRIGSLAREVTRGAKGEMARARALEKYLRENYAYSLEPWTQEVEDPLANFLFERRKGYCEYYASALAVMLRHLWIPARVVTGYQGGMYNPLSGWQVIRASDAHSWVEAFVAGRGWVTLDATPPDMNPRGETLWSKLGMWIDALDVFWQEWIISYDLDRQVTLAFQMEESGRRISWGWLDRLAQSVRRARGAADGLTWKQAAPWLAGLAGLAAMAFLAPMGWRGWQNRRRKERAGRGEASASDASLLYEQMLRLLKRRGYVKVAAETPLEFAGGIGEEGISRTVREFTVAYNGVPFGGRTAEAARLAELLEQSQKGPVSV